MPAAPYDTLETVVTTARVRLNDAIQAIGGDVLTDNAGFTIYVINAAWRRLQELLVNFGFSAFKQQPVISPIPLVTSADLGSSVWIDWTGYFDGTTLQSAPVLPQDFISPLLLWERTVGSGSVYTPVDQIYNGLPTIPKQTLNRVYEWRNNKIYMPGATTNTDMRIRYAAFFPDFVVNTSLAFALQPVPIMRSLNSLAWFICSEMAKARGDLDAGDFDAKAQLAAQYIFNLDPMQPRSIDKPSEYDKMTDRYTPTQGPAGPRGNAA